MNHFEINSRIAPELIKAAISGPVKISIAGEALDRVKKCREYLDQRVKNNNEAIYGVNTGFGALYNVPVSNENLEQLQENLVMSHACGAGNLVSPEIVRLMLILKIQSLVFGHSGVTEETVLRLADLVNEDILPVVYEQGSLGASGDLSPLAHVSLVLLGKGEVWMNNERKPATDVLRAKGFDPLKLKSKEGLALLNGTQFMSAFGVWCIEKAKSLSEKADMIASLSLEAFDGRKEPFYTGIHKVRPHKGQQLVAENMLRLLEGSEIISQEKKHVQDPYSFRCIPQVHGATRDAIEYAEKVIYTEINSVTDNPTIFPEEDLIISAGNFHGQPLALVLDFLAIAMAELGSISERRTFKLLSGQRGLPLFLVQDPGLNSGFMIPQYTAASIVSQNKQYCTPSSVDTIDSSNGQEDHVSMGANAATKAYRVLDNVETVLAIELMNAAQGVETRRPLKTSALLETLISDYRKVVPFVEKDVVMHDLIKASKEFLAN